MNGKSATDHGECLSDESSTDYLEGRLDSVVRIAFESHLVVCDKCRDNLAMFMRILREDVRPEEDVPLQQLSDPVVGAEAAAGPRVEALNPERWRRVYAFGGLAALFLMAFFAGEFLFGPRPSVALQAADALLARDRPFEPRVVGQPYMPIREITRSAEDPVVPDGLAAEMTESSAASYEIGRYYLLKKEYAKAIKHLKTAVADPKGVPPRVHNDLGVAYLQSGGPEISRPPK